MLREPIPTAAAPARRRDVAIRRRRARAPFFLVLGGLIALASAPAHASPVLKKVRKVGDMRIVIHYKNPEAEDAYTFTPSVELFRGEERLTGVRLKEVVTPPQVTVTEMDPGNDGPEILVSGYTGGAHCCTVIKVFTALGDGPDADWRVVDLGEFDGAPDRPKDIDEDGESELLVSDQRFLYRFGCYACSYAPPRIIAVRAGRRVDITRRAAFRPFLRRLLRRQERELRQSLKRGEKPDNGILAGYVAHKILIGEGPQGWRFMLRHYDRAWRERFCPVPRPNAGMNGDEGTRCPVPAWKLRFPLTLALFLRETGYITTR